MDMHCKKIEDTILQGKSNTVSQHIENCENCTQFLKAHNKLTSLTPNSLQAPINLQFNTIWEKSTSTKNITHLKWGSLMAAAAVLILVIYLPVSNLQYPGNIRSNNAYALLDTKIVEELENLDSDMFDIEDNLTDILIDMELDDIGTSLNDFV